MNEKIHRCPKCGRELTMEDVQCPYCGAELKRSRRIGKWILIPVVILVIALGAWVFLHNAPLLVQEPVPDTTAPQVDALEAALEYLDWAPFSQAKLQRWLEDDGYTPEQAADAIRRCGADWNAQALAAAYKTLEGRGYSLEGLRYELEYFEDFPTEQVDWALANLGEVDWQAQAALQAASYLEAMPLSRLQLLDQLIYEGFASEDAQYGVDHCGADWGEVALEAAQENSGLFTSQEKIREYLESCGFTRQEIQYALENM